MTGFAHPEALILLAVVPWVFLRRMRQPQAALRLPQAERWRAASRGAWRTLCDAALWSAAVTGLVLALAGPRSPDRKTRLPVEGIAFALVVDVSGSMATPDFAPKASTSTTRLNAAKHAFELFIDGRVNDAIALIAFAAIPETICPPTLNHQVLREMLNRLEPRSGVEAGTNIGDALAEALLRLQSSPAKRKALILLSDGEHNATGTGADAPLTPRQAAQLAANLNIPLYAIDCGGGPAAHDADSAAQRRAGRTILAACADLTGGRFFTADDETQLLMTLQEIDALEKTRIESYQFRRYFEFSHFLIGFALCCGVVSVLAPWLTGRVLP